METKIARYKKGASFLFHKKKISTRLHPYGKKTERQKQNIFKNKRVYIFTIYFFKLSYFTLLLSLCFVVIVVVVVVVVLLQISCVLVLICVLKPKSKGLILSVIVQFALCLK